MTASYTIKRSDEVGSAKALFSRLGPVTYLPVDALKRSGRNPRRHPERQLVALAASIREFGFIVPVLVTEGCEIIAGEARAEAAKRAGLVELPTLCASHLTEAQVRAFRLADNRLPELATWDLEALAVELEEIIALDEMTVDLLGWSTAEADVILGGSVRSDPAPDPADALVRPSQEVVSRAGDLWELGRHRLLCGSSLDPAAWERLLDDRSAGMVFTDPPYNVPVSNYVSGHGSIHHGEFAMASGEMSAAEFTRFLESALGAMLPHLREGGVVDLCIDWRHLSELLGAVAQADLTLLNLCVWNKHNAGLGSLYRSKHELVLIARKGDAPHVNNVALGRHGRYRTNVWDYPGANGFARDRVADLADHPTVKPVALVADAIRDVTAQGDVVLDGFAGSGTTLLACERAARLGYGVEIEPAFVDVAIRRWQQLTGKEAHLAGDGRTFREIATERVHTA